MRWAIILEWLFLNALVVAGAVAIGRSLMKYFHGQTPVDVIIALALLVPATYLLWVWEQRMLGRRNAR